MDLLRVDVYNGKYTIIQKESGELYFLRHGKPWPAANNSDWKYAKMILAMAQEIQFLRDCDKDIEEKTLDNLGHSW